MQITKDTVVSLDYTLTDGKGRTLDSSTGREPLVYLHGHQNIIPGLESELEGMSAGEQASVVVPPESGYGVRDDQLVQVVPASAFQGAGTIEPGMRFRAQGPAGQMVVTVTDVAGDKVTIDANHPLAGVELHFDVKVVDVRNATPEEVSHGHAHGVGGHHH